MTLLELTVVVGILVVLLALLLPILGRVRQSSRDAVCAGRLRDLVLACSEYYSHFDAYPDPSWQESTIDPSLHGRVEPQRVARRLMNGLAPFLSYPPVGVGARAEELPLAVQCPTLEAAAVGRGPFAGAEGGDSLYYTGYMYVGRLAESPNLVLDAGGVLRDPKDVIGQSAAAVWSARLARAGGGA